MTRFPLDTPIETPSANDRLLYSDVSDRNLAKDLSISDAIGDAFSDGGASTDNLPEGGSNQYCSNDNISANPDVVLNEASRHSHSNKDLLDSYDQTNADISDLVSKTHSHSNKALLDSIAFTGDGTKILDDQFNFVAPPVPDPESFVAANAIILEHQPMNISVVAGDCVVFNGTEWVKVTPLRETPTGVYMGVSGQVALMGKGPYAGSALSGGCTYYLGANGGLSLVNTYGVKIGFAIDASTFVVDIDVEGSNRTVPGQAGYGVGIGSGNLKRHHIYSDTMSVASSFIASGGSTTTFCSPTHGYVNRSNVDTSKMAFSNETISTVSISFSINNTGTSYLGRGAVWSGTRGYLTGGANLSYSNDIESIRFSDDTYNNTSSSLTEVSCSNAGMSSTVAGYIANIRTSAGGSNNTSKLTFSDESVSASVGTNSSGRGGQKPATGFSSSVGYLIGGGAPSTEIDGINFYNDTYRNPGAVSNAGCHFGFSTMESTYSGSSAGNTHKLTHLTETSSTIGIDMGYLNPRWYPSLTGVAGGVGYVLGGATGSTSSSATSTKDKIEFLSDTVSTDFSTIGGAYYNGAGLSSVNVGYVAGGSYPDGSIVSRIQGVFYPTGTVYGHIVGLSKKKNGARGVYFADSGYVCGGIDSLGNTIGDIDKITFSSGTVSAIVATIQSRRNHASLSSTVKGYLVGGNGSITDSNSLTFSTETTSTFSNMLATSQNVNSAGAMGSSAGYIAGGRDFGILNSIQKLSNNEVWSYISATISFKEGLTGNESSSNGYFSGGDTSFEGMVPSNSIEKLGFSTETISGIVSTLGVSKASSTGVHSTPPTTVLGARAYSLTGSPGSGLNQTYLFDTDTSGTYAATLTQAIDAASFNSATNGYGAGGTGTNSIWKLSFLTETMSLTSTTASGNGINTGGVNSSTNGYFTRAGLINRLDFSTDTNASVGVTITETIDSFGGHNSSTDGFIGGRNPSGFQGMLVKRFNFETLTFSTQYSSGTYLRGEANGINSTTSGYMGGGDGSGAGSYGSYYSKTNYSTFTNTVTSMTPGNSSTASNISGGYNSTTKGWFRNSNAAVQSKGINFSNDTQFNAPSGSNGCTNWVQSGGIL